MAPSKYQRYSDAVKHRVITAARDGHDWKAVVSHNGVKVTSARNWVQRFVIDAEQYAPDRRGGKQYEKITSDHLDYLQDRIGTNCHLTLQQMCDELEAEFEVEVTPPAIKNRLDGLCISLKKTHIVPQYMNTDINMKKRREYLSQLLDYQALGKDIYYVDETNFNTWCSRTQGWSRRGLRSLSLRTAGGGENMHVSACISVRGMVFYEKRFGSNKWPTVNDFLCRMLQYMQATVDLSNAVVVLDNAPSHSRVEQVFNDPAFAGVKLLRLGPYSPMLNPIKNVFSSFKAKVKQYLTDQRQAIIRTPAGVTMKAHRRMFLEQASDFFCLEQSRLKSAKHFTITLAASIWMSLI